MLFEIWRFRVNKNQKLTLHPICPYIYFLAHRQSVLFVQQLYIYVFYHLGDDINHLWDIFLDSLEYDI
jgi:hypothetical protein